MIDLDSQEVKKLDKKNYYASVLKFPRQVEQAWVEVKKIRLPADYSKAANVVINGMGGSGLGGLVIKSLFQNRLKVPLELTSGYTVPAYVGPKTLYIFSSYSGTTEEVLAVIDEVVGRGAKCLGITTGGKLAEILTEKEIPFYKIDPKYNPAGQPRAAVGYSVMGAVGLIAAVGLIEVSDSEVKELVVSLDSLGAGLTLEVPHEENPAKTLAYALKEKLPILAGANFLAGSLQVFRNQLHETAKNYADYYLIPDLNHHLMEGLSFPWTNPENLAFVFFDSPLNSPQIKRRFAITKEVVVQNKLEAIELSLRSQAHLGQAFELIQLGGFSSFYLAMLNGVDPSAIPWVDYFKEKLKS